MVPIDWPADLAGLAALQERLGRCTPEPWSPTGVPTVGASYCCAGRPSDRRQAPSASHDLGGGGHAERGWAGAVVPRLGGNDEVVVSGALYGAYQPGYLARREGPLREAAVRRLAAPPDVLIVDAAGRDHPRRAGLALHLGAVVDVPTVGATDRPLVAGGPIPPDRRGATSPLRIDGEVVGYWVRVVPGVRPLAVHAGWRCGPEDAVEVVLADASGYRTPRALRHARRAARDARAAFPEAVP